MTYSMDTGKPKISCYRADQKEAFHIIFKALSLKQIYAKILETIVWRLSLLIQD